MIAMKRCLLCGILTGLMILAASCTRGNGGPKPGQDTPPAPTATPAPTPAPASGEGDPGEVEISWDATIFKPDIVQGFHIFRCDTIDGKYLQVTNELIDIISGVDGVVQFVDQGVTMGKTYYYQIQVVTKMGERPFWGDPIEITVNRPRGLTPQ